MKKKIFVRAAVMAAALFCGGVLTGCGGAKETILLDDYVNVSVSGLSGHGKAVVSFAEDSFEQKIKDLGIEKYGSQEKYNEVLYKVLSSKPDLEYSDAFPEIGQDKVDGLKNGDVVNVTCEYPDDTYISLVLAATGADYKYEGVKYKVEGLKEPIEIPEEDVFKDLEITYNGYSPFLEPSFKSKSKEPYAEFLSFTYDRLSDMHEAGSYSETSLPLSAGDKFTVKAILKNPGFSDSESGLSDSELSRKHAWEKMEADGYVLPAKTESLEFKKEFTVDADTTKYIAKYSEYPDKYKKKLLSLAKDAAKTGVKDIASYTVSWGGLFGTKDFKVEKIEFKSATFVARKPLLDPDVFFQLRTIGVNDENNFRASSSANAVIYYINCKMTNKKGDKHDTIPFYVKFSNLTVNGDEKINVNVLNKAAGEDEYDYAVDGLDEDTFVFKEIKLNKDGSVKK